MKKLFVNGNIITMNETIVNSVLIEDDLIIQVGNDIVDEEAEIIDLDGKTILPSFIDAHSHLTAFASSFLEANLENTNSFDEIEARLNQFRKENQIREDDWIVGNGYDHNVLKEKTHPTKNFLDQAFPNQKILIKHISGHFGVLNTKALEELGIMNDKNGYLEENEFVKEIRKIPMPSIEKYLASYRKALAIYASYGITTIQEGMMLKEMVPLYQELIKSHMLNLDVVGYPSIQDGDDIYNVLSEYQDDYKDNFRLGGYKIILDGSPQGRTAWMLTPYQDSEEYCGYGSMTDEEVYQAILKATIEHRQILAHCNGDRAAKQYIDMLYQVNKMSPNKVDRPVMIHAQLLNVNQIEDLKKLGIIPSFFVAHCFHWGDIHIKNFGFERAQKISPVKECIDKNIIYTFHQDTPVIKPNMLETIWCAVTRITKSGIVLGEDEKISVYDALKGVTINAAIQYGEEKRKGSIEIGKLANFVIINADILNIDVNQIRNIEILETIHKGKTIYKK